MKILITSGGTTEKIDAVRGITNHSTGYLGKENVELFLAKSHQVTLVTTKTAVKPEPKENLKRNYERRKSSKRWSHSSKSTMFLYIVWQSLIILLFIWRILVELEDTEDLAQFLHKSNTESKISSASDYQVLFLKKTPKVKASSNNGILIFNWLASNFWLM